MTERDRSGGRARTLLARAKPWAMPALAVALLGLAAFGLQAMLATVTVDRITQAFVTLDPASVALALGFTVLSFTTLVGYDLSALRHVQVRLPLALVATASFCGYAIGNTAGFSMVTGGSVRYRLYSAAGLGPGQIGRIAVFAALAFAIGVTAISAAALLIRPDLLAAAVHEPGWVVELAALAALAVVAGLVLLSFVRREIRIGRFAMRLPTGGLVLFQLAISMTDLVFAGASLWVLLPPHAVPFTEFLPVYGIALVMGLLSHLPAGLGVFEAVFLVSLGGSVGVEALVAGLVAYRAIYYVVPLLAAMALLAGSELMRHGRRAGDFLHTVFTLGSTGVPVLLAILAVVAGGVLVASAAVPQAAGLAPVRAALPAVLIELSSWLGSLFGVGLIVLAQGLYRRLNAAWWLSAAGLAVGAVMSLARGIWVEAAVLAAVFAVLVPCRRRFPRHTSLLDRPFTPGWILSVGAVLAALGWLTLFTMDHAEYANRTWWQLTLDGTAPPAIRAALAAMLAAAVIGVTRLLRPAPPRPAAAAATPAEIGRALRIVSAQERAEAGLVALGDKALLFSESGRSFLMFARRRGSAIALFDPIGPEFERRGLIRQFLRQCAAERLRPAFYQVRPHNQALYVEAGLDLLPVGEAARVPLAGFDLAAPAHAALAERTRRAAARGVTVRAAAGAEPALAALSQAWLGGRPERGFAMGSFPPAALAPAELFVASERGRPAAFATLLGTGLNEEAAVDLFRYAPGTDPALLDCLVLQLIRHAAAAGCRWLDLGLAPLSGLEDGRASPAWTRLGSAVFEQAAATGDGGRVRQFRQAFQPVWERRFLATPGGLNPLAVLTDLAALIGGGRASN